MDKVSVFESSDFGELRIIVDPKGDVWFVASDVAKSLGYINAKDAVKRHVDDDDSMLLQVSDNQWGVKRSILKTRYIDSIRIINESGLYSLILSSKLESAKRFKKWVTSEVLPSIRKTGEYKTSSGGKGILVPDFSNPADAARAWADQYEAAQKAIAEKSQAEAEKQQALKTIEEHKPDVEFAESFRKVDHNTIAQLREEKAALTASVLSQQQTQNIVGQLRPTAVPAYPSCSPYQAYTWGQVFGGGCCNNGCGCNNGCCNNNAAV